MQRTYLHFHKLANFEPLLSSFEIATGYFLSLRIIFLRYFKIPMKAYKFMKSFIRRDRNSTEIATPNIEFPVLKLLVYSV